jgi:hypothetical protein
VTRTINGKNIETKYALKAFKSYESVYLNSKIKRKANEIFLLKLQLLDFENSSPNVCILHRDFKNINSF